MQRWKILLSVAIYSSLFLFTFRHYIADTPVLTETLHNHTVTDVASSPETCENGDRLQRARKWCNIQENVNRKLFPNPRALDYNALKRVVKRMFVDEKHKVLYCGIAKSGSTTWKHILANNTGHYSENGLKTQLVHGVSYFRAKYNITQLVLEDREAILYKLKNYYKFIVVRHPLDRLISAYRDKLAGTNKYYETILGRRILAKLRPNAPLEVIAKGHGVTFPEYVTYVTQTHMMDQHFENYQDHCQPCIINYDYIVKLETQARDGKYIINEHLSGYGADILVNQHSTRGGATLLKRLPEYEQLKKQSVHEISSVYSRDMDMFGYSVVERNNTVLAACGDGDVADCC